MTRDTVNLRHDADFRAEVYPGVYWVPANRLGSSAYHTEEIKKLIKLPPEEKRGRITTLYEAIQLYQESRFFGYIDNVRVLDEYTTVMWVFHKPGIHSVRTNGGCCAADANWLVYMLKGKYDEIGCFCYFQPDGNGHLINYIKHGGSYYFVDMMPQRHDQLHLIDIENGDPSSLMRNIGGHIFMSDGFDSYISFLLSALPLKPVLFYRYTGESYAIGSQFEWRKLRGLWALFPKKDRQCIFHKDSVEILYSKSDDIYKFSDTVALEPNWALAPSFDLN